MEHGWIYFLAFFTAIVTLLTGFGLGTVLTPVFTFFYDVKIAVLIVALIHILNNLFKLALFKGYVDYSILKRFGLVSIFGSILGSVLQYYFQSNLVKVLLGSVLLLLGISKFLPAGLTFRLPRRFDRAGGFLSGLLGGLVGNQGAIRSAYLLNYGLSKERFIATATIRAVAIDLTRLPVYIISNTDLISEFK